MSWDMCTTSVYVSMCTTSTIIVICYITYLLCSQPILFFLHGGSPKNFVASSPKAHVLDAVGCDSLAPRHLTGESMWKAQER